MQLQLERFEPSARVMPGLLALSMPAAVRDAMGRAWTRPIGLVVVTGPHADATAAALRDVSLAQDGGVLSDRGGVAAAVEAAECGRVVAVADAPDAIATMMALRRLAPDRFALAATLRLVLAQRRAARLCDECRAPVQAFGSDSALLGLDPGAILWRAEGCERCADTGRAGTIDAFEAVEIDSAMRRLFYDGADAPLLARHAFVAAPNLAAAARALAREGAIAAEEAVRISRG